MQKKESMDVVFESDCDDPESHLSIMTEEWSSEDSS